MKFQQMIYTQQSAYFTLKNAFFLVISSHKFLNVLQITANLRQIARTELFCILHFGTHESLQA